MRWLRGIAVVASVALLGFAQEEAPQPAAQGGVPWWVWIIVAVVVIALVGFLLRKRKRGKEGE